MALLLCPWGKLSSAVTWLGLIFLLHTVGSQDSAGGSLHPPSFNLAQGARIRASATCGQEENAPEGPRSRMDLYCKLVGGPVLFSHTIQGQFCDFCDSSDPNKAHPSSNAIDGTERWWQSPPLSLGMHYNEINVTIDLGQLFHVAYVLIKFANSPRPDLWVLERSIDFGNTYMPWQYFANSKHDCLHQFGKEAKQPITRDDDVICTTEYSRIVPLENGEVVVRLVTGRPGAKHFMDAPVLRDFTKATNIRLRFLRTNTLLGHLISKAEKDATVTRRYYYSIKDISIGGRCVCHGHASDCTVRNAGNQNLYQCQCQHNTCGENCDHCCPGYNQKLWRPATIDTANQCEPCNCHGHASDCYYDSAVDNQQASLDIHGRYSGGGVCINCQHNTAGVNCEKCALGYYRPYGVRVETPHGCLPCSCNPDQSDGCEEGSGRCYCKPNFTGHNCERCAQGYYGYPVCMRNPYYPVTTTSSPVRPTADNIKVCRCTGIGALSNNCDRVTGQCPCHAGFQGTACDRCAAGFFHYPFCQRCNCHDGGVLPEVCSPAGKCLCKSRIEGERCDQCRPGYHSFPVCNECNCDTIGVATPSCGPRGECYCRPNYAGQACTECAPSFYSYPLCLPCQCSVQGSYQSTCDPMTGQCECRPGITGQKCDRCSFGLDGYPYCQEFNGDCNPAGTITSQAGHCQCLPRVEGVICDQCKPLYWNLDQENAQGCIDCSCNLDGTVSGVGECHQTEGECHCKPNTCSTSCGTCKDGYFYLEGKNYFGCRGCQCDVGGSISHLCDESSGKCVCRNNIEGNKCNQPKQTYYFPDLHQMKYEVEDGTSINGRGVRFGYNPEEFPGFSWRGYAQMSSIQNEVRIPVTVDKSNLNLFCIILRYVNPEKHPITGQISAYRSRLSKGSDVKDIVFHPSREPAFLTVPGKSFAQPFSLAPGNWIIRIVVEGVLLDYLVLLPSDYYEAPILQLPVTEPCSYTGPVGENCLVYQHLPMEKFTCVHGPELEYFKQDGVLRPTAVRQMASGAPLLAHISGRQVELHFRVKIPRAGFYALVFEYANEDPQQYVLNVMIRSNPSTAARVRLYNCKYSFLCRSIVVDSMNRIATFELLSDAEIQVTGSSVSFLLHTVCIVPIEEFSVEYAESKVHCVAAYGRAPDQSPSCVHSSVYETPPLALFLNSVKDAVHSDGQKPIVQEHVPVPGLPGNRVQLKSPQNDLTLAKRIPHTGRYVFIVHFYQTDNPTFPVTVMVNGGAQYSGTLNASYCPNVFGCRELVAAGNRIGLDITNPDLSVTVIAPPEKSLVLESVLLVPAESYSYDLLQEKPLDKSFDFINLCGENSFYIDPVTSPEFCRDSAKSLAAYYNDGALPCRCHAEGATSLNCNPVGGQCSCRPNIIGRTCSRCATGYYGFPHCRPCNCGQRLCDEMTGRCICPPHTVRPSCEVCEQHSFSYHPLLGCEGCNCSTTGIMQPFRPECDGISGQCRCKPRITGRQCDRCASGYFRFPDCIPCNCDPYGTGPQICDPYNGICLCKENAEGPKCDACQSGTFYFDASNAKGCTKCFCFGATNVCHSSSKLRKKFVDMRSWNLETSDQTRVAITFNPGSNSVVADVQELPPSVHSLHWVAPEFYLGERISSYGGYLTYQLKSFGLPNEMTLLDRRPDVLLTGRQMTIVYVDPSNPLPDKQYYGRVQLLEGNFRHASSNSLVSREELMMILSKLENLHIRALYFTETQRLTLAEVGLEDVTISGSGRVAHNVEICACPPEYIGDSCQECSPGHYRENQGLYLGRCVPCRCNGHSTRCHDGTGICINCQHNTAGDHCERCKEGYTGNASQGSCSLCACPLPVPSNSFATGCTGSGRSLRCFCKPGYTGFNCGECARGYYGNPLRLGGRCQPCNCGNNGQLGDCDPLTGECLDEDPKDTGEDDLCDSCVHALLKDLETVHDELNLVKVKLQSMNATSQALQQIRDLEARIQEVKLQYDSYNSKLTSQRQKMDSLQEETNGFKQQIAALLAKAQENHRKYETIMENVDNTFQSASKTLLNIDVLLKNINILIKEVASGQEGPITPGDMSIKMAEVERMLNEMRRRDFNPQKVEAEREKQEANALLNRVRNQFQKHLDQHKELMKEISNSIKDFEAKVNDLRDALDEASAQTKQANNLNKDNTNRLEDIKKRIADLSRQQKEASDHLKGAETSLGQTRSMMSLLQKSQEEYEKLAAQLDGAKQELNEKVNLLSKAASKEPLVIMAEEHAQSLQNLANQLLEIKRNTSQEDLVRGAVEASNAYDNIIDAVKAADEASKTAKLAADSALTQVQNEDLPGKAKKSLTDSEALLEQAKKTQKSLTDINPELQDIKDRLAEATEKRNNYSADFIAVENSINEIKRDDIEKMINSAKDLVTNANKITDGVLGELKPIQEDVDKLKGTITTGQNEIFNEALKEATESVNKLTGSLPGVFEAMNRINDLMPLGNISESVSRIRELIQQARDAANKVVVPMRFDGSSGVEVRPPNNLEDLKAYTSLSFFLQRPPNRGDRRKRQLLPNMFVMYLGSKDTSKDYLGIGVEDDKLKCVYNLGGNMAEINVDPYISVNKPEEAIMDRVVLQRIYQYVTLNYTKAFTSSRPDSTLSYNADIRRQTLLNLNEKDVVFYVGGYPDDFTPPPGLNYPKYRGCIELDDLNQNGISLYNFRKTFNINTTMVEPCKRFKEESERSFFEGTGYAKITYTLPAGDNLRLRYEQTVQTTTDTGLLFFAENEDNYISVEIEDGILVLKYKLNSNPVKKSKTTFPRISDGLEHLTELLIVPKSKLLRIRQDLHSMPEPNVDVFTFSTYYLGGVPSAIREQFNIETRPFRGCVKNVKSPQSGTTFSETYGVSQRCYDDWNIIRSAEFADGGTLGLKPDGFSFPADFQASFGFQTPQTNAMLLNHKTQSDDLRISLEDGTVTVTTKNTELRSQDRYTDGATHYVSVIRQNDELKLLVDDKQVTENIGSSRSSSLSPTDIYLGGNGFKGCVTNVFISRASQNPTVQSLAVNTEKNKVSLGVCKPEEAPIPLILKAMKQPLSLNDFGTYDLNLRKTSQQGCSTFTNLTSLPRSYRFGDFPASNLAYNLTKHNFKDGSHFSLEVRTVESSGLIFLITDKLESSHLALHISKGHLVFSLGTKGNKMKIRSQEKYNDGKWHTAVFTWDGTDGQLVIDGLKARKGNLRKQFTLDAMTLLYLGGVPALKIQGMPKKSFIGCLKNVKINEVPIEKPSHIGGVTPCYEGLFEPGMYFAAGASHIDVENSFDSEFEITFEIRPQELSGVLLHLGDKPENRLSLYMADGKVTLSVNNGAGDFKAWVAPSHWLCDGKWHTITVSQKGNAVQLYVDSESKQTAGPNSALYSSIKAPLYIGGLPASMETPWLPEKKPFIGCMRNLKVNKKDISKMSKVHGAISLNRCPAA